jgi:hypothetical protein
MATIANQVIQIRFVVATGSVVPCIGSSKGIDAQARADATFDLPISLTYLSGGRYVTVGGTVAIRNTTFIQDIDAMTVMTETTFPGPRPDAGANCTATIRITTRAKTGAPIDVTTNTTTVVPITIV